jgi:general secretion pathway protein K
MKRKMKRKILNNEKGIVLLLVIGLVSVLSIITLQFGMEMRQQYVVAAGLRYNFQLSEMAKSGITITQGLLLQDLEDNQFDSFFDSWALLSDDDLAGLFEYGTIKVQVIDESGKFPVNAMVDVKKEGAKKPKDEEETKNRVQHEKDVRNILWRLMRAEPFRMEDGDAREIIDSLIDWIDTGDNNGAEEYGAEDSYYMSLDPPYHCKNGPVESIEELLLVQGITEELLYGTEDTPPLAPLLTVWGDDGKVNLNTAEVLLLQAMAFDIDKNAAETLVTYREDEANKEQLASPGWYKTVPSFPGDIDISENLLTTESHYFTIKALAESNELTKIVAATVARKKKEIAIVQWQTE